MNSRMGQRHPFLSSSQRYRNQLSGIFTTLDLAGIIYAT